MKFLKLFLVIALSTSAMAMVACGDKGGDTGDTASN